MKPNEFRELVNELRDTAVKYHDHHSLRERVVHVLWAHEVFPDAQPTPSEQDESVRKSWARFSNELHRSPNAPYPGMADAFEQHFSQSFTDRDWRVESGVWAAAWKAAKRHCGQIAPSVPDRWKLVPIDPTPNMLTAAILSSHAINVHRAECCYRAMLAAAPEAKP